MDRWNKSRCKVPWRSPSLRNASSQWEKKFLTRGLSTHSQITCTLHFSLHLFQGFFENPSCSLVSSSLSSWLSSSLHFLALLYLKFLSLLTHDPRDGLVPSNSRGSLCSHRRDTLSWLIFEEKVAYGYGLRYLVSSHLVSLLTPFNRVQHFIPSALEHFKSSNQLSYFLSFPRQFYGTL